MFIGRGKGRGRKNAVVVENGCFSPRLREEGSQRLNLQTWLDGHTVNQIKISRICWFWFGGFLTSLKGAPHPDGNT